MKRTSVGFAILVFVLLFILSTSGMSGYALGTADSVDGWAWVQKQPTDSPCAREGAALVYDSDLQKIILFGGFIFHPDTSIDTFTDTWTWDGNNWKLMTTIGPWPSSGKSRAIAYDKARKETVLYTGTSTWILKCDGTNALWEFKTNQGPPWGWGHTMSYDSLNNVTVLFSGYDEYTWPGFWTNCTWEWDGTKWTQMEIQGPIPEGRSEAKLAYIGDGKTLVYGGHNYTSYLNNTWVYQRTPQGAREWNCLCSTPDFSCPACTIPSDRSYHFMAYDPDSALAVLFGGYNMYANPTHLDDTWVWDGINWIQVPIPDGPSRRCDRSRAMVYDEARHEMVLFGGKLEPGTVCAGDTWVLRKKTYTYEGFFGPIENKPVVNQAKAGQAIPVKWRITDKDGIPISDPASFISITSYRVDCGTFEDDPTSLVEEFASGASGLQYLGDGSWQFNWKTSKTYVGQCRTMKLTLDDYSEYIASFSFR